VINPECKNKTVLLTGAGGPAPAGMISVLRNWGYRIVTVDMLQHSPAFYLSDKSYVVPAGNSSEFLPKLRSICKKEDVEAVISVVDEELLHVSKLEEDGIQVIQPRAEFVNLCLDKYRCMTELRSRGINAAETWLANEVPNNAPYPLFIKPRIGRGSRGIGKVTSPDELRKFLSASTYLAHELLAQPYIPGTEFTVSVVVWRDGEVQAVVPKEIISKVGVTKLAVTRKNKKIHDLCVEIQNEFRADGPFNVQLSLDEDGNPVLFEINPRFSTSITLTMAAGVDELGGILSQALFGGQSHQISDWKEGVVLVRHTTDQFLSEEEYRDKSVII
jgi:carbamoyl-phosphate synthase large subunit